MRSIAAVITHTWGADHHAVSQMDVELHNDLCTRFRAIRDVLHTMSVVSAQTREELETRLDDCASLQSVLSAASSRYRASLSSNEVRRLHYAIDNEMLTSVVQQRFFTELEVLLGDQIDEKRRDSNAFVDTLAGDPTPSLVAAVDLLFQMLPSISFVLKEHTVEKVAFLQCSLFDRIPFLRDSSRGEVAMPREVPSGAIDAAINLSASSPLVTELVVEDVTRVLGQIAAKFAFRHSNNVPHEGEQQFELLHETNVVSAQVRRLLEQVTALCRFTNQLKQRARDVYDTDIQRLQRCIAEDLRSKNNAVEAVMSEFRQVGRATWPAPRLSAAPLSALAQRMPSRHRAHFLSCEQIRALATAFLDRERVGTVLSRDELRQDEFLSVLLETARRSSFPGSWQNPTSLASVVLKSSAAESLSWRQLVSAILCAQCLGIPTEHDLTQYAQRATALARTKNENVEDEDIRLSREHFSQLPLWFEERVAGAVAAELKDLVFLLFSSTTGSGSSYGRDAREPTLALIPMLLEWCRHPSRRLDIRDDLSAFLPRYSRGLARATRVLAHLSSSPPAAADAHVTAARRLRQLLTFAQLPIDDQRIDELTRESGGSDLPTTAASLLRLCDAYDVRLAAHFLFSNPIDALLLGSP